MQELANTRYFKLRKIHTLYNTADALTKYVDRDTLVRHLASLSVQTLSQYHFSN